MEPRGAADSDRSRGFQSDSGEIREDGEPGGQRGSRRLGAQHGWQSVAGAARATGGHEIRVGLLELIRSALERGKIVPQGARNGLFQGLLERLFAIFQSFFLLSIMETP